MISFSQLNKGLSDPKISTMNFLNEITNKYPDAISFAPGRPPEKNFDVEKSFRYINRYLEHTNASSTLNYEYSFLGQYGPTKGIIGEIICKLLQNDESIVATPEDVIMTVGCQEAMCICLLALAANPGDVLLVENPAYVGVVGAAKLFGIEVVGIPTDENGIILESLSNITNELKKIKKTPKLLYLSPDFSNPTGNTIDLQQRLELLKTTKKLGLMILEDHAYNYFFYNDSRIRCLKSLPNSEHVIYLGSFSKSIYPGLRIGYLVANQKIDGNNNSASNLSDELSKIKSFFTVNSSPINQAIAGGLIISNDYSLLSYTKTLRNLLKENRNSMVDALNLYFPTSDTWCRNIEWNIPTGGFFLTLKLPFSVTDSELYTCAEKYGVIWTPMSYFDTNEVTSNNLRLSFSYVNELQISSGIKRLSQFVKDLIKIQQPNQL